MSNESNLIFLDLETTGLAQNVHTIAEIGMIVFNTTERREVARFERVLPLTPEQQAAASPAAREMHQASGLWAECVNLGLTDIKGDLRQIVENEAAAFVRLYTESMGRKSPMCGNSIGFDRAFLFKEMMHFHHAFDRFNLDVSSFNVVADRFYPDKLFYGMKRVRTEGGGHRAVADCEDSIKQFMGYLEQLDKITGTGRAIPPQPYQEHVNFEFGDTLARYYDVESEHESYWSLFTTPEDSEPINPLSESTEHTGDEALEFAGDFIRGMFDATAGGPYGPDGTVMSTDPESIRLWRP